MARRQGLATAGLLALLVVDLALVLLAFLSPFRSTGGAAQPAPVTSSTVSGAASDGGSPTSPGTAAPAGPGIVGIVPFDTDKAWRFAQGSCSGEAATLAVTTDGGKTWRTITQPLKVITRVQPTDDSKVAIIGADDGCQPVTRKTTDAGATWSPNGAAATWHRSPVNPREVSNASGKVLTPCAATGSVITVESLSAAAAQVLCSTSKVLETADAGATWSDVSKALEVFGLDNSTTGGKVVADIAYRADGCAGLQIATLGNGPLTKLGCLDLDQSALVMGSVALATRGEQSWLLVGTATWVSADGGKTWKSR